ncbi:chimeric spermidine synthase/saccharopine dehydrogenase [Trichosporon asahii var. asahii CBS 2479]|uniref:Chimeric spermidine synthase/saccharopine dehydrogenase n=1 Tax=Trichosporon asahii var. asahii (strain ATCC 90039 / CBS 2479 / JCM 2466 / KCTC 7840 / NBRC 103889/ NCYC 2677 / UAMH 7654) TaxID=1186058 RepID=J6F540_TRIAS|nr:chimeric spermidine synthase/saccharopine dehydrogenase [Trichosporon asahii var. asahii CBS 2479]EJT52134.1 chimeric spermidine synthase/saccharopine dehydrogenase [Trichosporon asahii var. asahii CBS 2479]
MSSESVPQSHPSIVDGWFREISPQWPGQAMTLKVNRILHHEKSLFQDVLVFESETYGNVLVLDGAIQVTERDEFSYQEMITHLPMNSHPNPERVLVIGGGDGGVIREALMYDTVKKVTLCDIDEAVIRVSKQFLPGLSKCYDDPRVEVFIGDGFKFLPEHENEYDVIVTDSSDPVGPAAALFEAPYFTLLRNALREGGHMSTQGESIWLHLPLIKELRETTKKLFPVAEYATSTIPTYPSGSMGFLVCSKEPTRQMNKPIRQVPDCKYYNNDVHTAAFVLPEFGRAMVEDGKNILPVFGGVRPGANGQTSGKKVLLLGSGLVAQPAAKYITEHGHELTIACRTLKTAQDLAQGLENATAVSVDVSSPEALRAAVKGHDVVVSLVPYTHHRAVMEAALAEGAHVVTTSYINPQMRELDQKFKDAGLVCFNEIGLDPGVDHLYAVKIIDEIHKAGGKVKSFYSYCGGLTEPAASDNALGYKFSWSPVGVLMALNNTGRFLKDGEPAVIGGGKDLMQFAKPYYFTPAYNLVAYPNRDSTVFREFYGIPECENLIRGTMRYGGFCEVVMGWADLGLLNDEQNELVAKGAAPITWLELTAKQLGVPADKEKVSQGILNLPSVPKDQSKVILQKYASLGMLSDEPVAQAGTLMRALSALLETKCQFEPGEVDLVLLQHTFEVIRADGREETVVASLEEYGDRHGGPSAMARLVGVPCGLAVQLLLEGKLNKPGVHAPYDEPTAKLFRDRLESEEGVKMVEKVF